MGYGQKKMPGACLACTGRANTPPLCITPHPMTQQQTTRHGTAPIGTLQRHHIPEHSTVVQTGMCLSGALDEQHCSELSPMGAAHRLTKRSTPARPGPEVFHSEKKKLVCPEVSKICTAPTDGGWSATDGGWRVTDGSWRVTDGGWRQSATRPRPGFVTKKRK